MQKLTKPLIAAILEDFVGNQMPIKDICTKYKLSRTTISAAFKHYFNCKPVIFTITINEDSNEQQQTNQ